MPIPAPLLEDQASLNAWMDQVTEELNDAREELAAALVRIQALEDAQ